MGWSYRNRVRAEQFARARTRRAQLTTAESALWQELRRRGLGVPFRRQHVVLGWIVDFYCPETRLVIEVDGMSHAGREARDAHRDEVMRAAGFTVLRLRNGLILRDMAEALRRIRREIAR